MDICSISHGEKGLHVKLKARLNRNTLYDYLPESITHNQIETHFYITRNELSAWSDERQRISPIDPSYKNIPLL